MAQTGTTTMNIGGYNVAMVQGGYENHFQTTISHPIPLSVLVILSHTSFARRLFFQTMEPCGKTHLTKSFCGYLDNLGSKALVSPNGL